MWSQQTTLSLIEDLYSAPCLWDVQCAAYRNRTSKIDALEALAKKYEVNAVDMEKKIQALKNQFRREHKKLLNSRKSGSFPKNTWFGYEHLLFLFQSSRGSHLTDNIQEMTKETVDKMLEDTETEGNLEDDCENETSTSECSAEIICEEPATTASIINTSKRKEFFSQPKPQKRTNDTATETFACMKTLTETVPGRDEYSIYGEHVANRLRNSGMSRLEIAIAQHEIDNICFKLTMGAFSHMTRSFARSSPSSHSVTQSPAISPHPSVSSQETY